MLQKTDKARQELSPGVRTLSLRERSLLLMADGRPIESLQAMYNGMGAQIVQGLIHQGYLAFSTAHAPAPAVASAPITAPAPAPAPAPATAHALTSGAEHVSQSDESTSAADIPAPSATRSLAGTRMYLFDINERMFARRNADLAREFHEALRNARDRDSMLEVGEALLDEITNLAGHDRAASVRERLVQLLP
ncbi:hypothetical protein [Diaphorobacter sp. MNS-0]|uniref:hypothetical protein n=1 Tax=Diaphorobacter sp. MNS-0 TaxID=2866628 RepID=UPI001C7388F3|nr:hypothetical protein [Diaphorobacter sp. MNS-0]QYY24720.1 hypothetical protein K2L43_13625 [Diaphorobacter sp. MNS-0]